jgi:hypothetical protein
MKAYRYNSIERSDRRFNTTGNEKNPNKVKFFAKSLEYANNYKTIFNEQGYELYDCELEVVEVNAKLFNMESNFKSLNVYRNYISELVNKELNDYRKFEAEAKSVKERKMWANQIAHTVSCREAELTNSLKTDEFQELSDFERQNDLVAELKGLGFDGYETKNEIAIF